ncbi:putative protein 61-2, partial [Rhizopogon vesiculosus]
MSEDDRAAKAARAKAMLKKRQQKKSAGGSALASPPPSRLSTPAPHESAPLTGDTKNDVADLFTPADSDANWIDSLPRADVPQSSASGILSTPPPTQASTSPHKAPQHVIASASVSSSNGEALETGARFQLKKLEEERSALQLRLQQEEHRTQDALRRVEVAIQETRSLESKYRSSQAGILQLES